MAAKDKEIYQSPLGTRYASKYMSNLFSQKYRIVLWRKLWTSLAKAEKELGLNITKKQIDEMEKNVENIDWNAADKKEKEVRHDVMAHVYAFGKAAPSAKGIIHLGATSCYVTDNSDLVIYREALKYIRKELLSVLSNLADFAEKYKETPTLGYTHYQVAQLVTVGKRAALWMQDFLSDLEELDFFIKNMRFLGCRGATGTEASLMELFEGQSSKVNKLNKMIAKDFGFEKIYTVSGQTYPRKTDARILNILSDIAQSAYKMANDIRLLQHDRQLEEPFMKKQIGSSAMPYKRNPMHCERICALSRYVISNQNNGSMTASTQWLERTLDDSANRRLSMSEGFLTTDSVLRLCQDLTTDLQVNLGVINKSLETYLPFIATENLLMEAVKRGEDRQKMHEIIRQCSMKATKNMQDGKECDLLKRLAQEKDFPFDEKELESLLDPKDYIGRCKNQVEDLLRRVRPLIKNLEKTEAEIAY